MCINLKIMSICKGIILEHFTVLCWLLLTKCPDQSTNLKRFHQGLLSRTEYGKGIVLLAPSRFPFHPCKISKDSLFMAVFYPFYGQMEN